MEKFTQTFEEFLNEDEQKDLMRVLKVMKKNRDDFKKALKDDDNEFTDAQVKELEGRIEQLNFLINQNEQYIRGSKINTEHGDRKFW